MILVVIISAIVFSLFIAKKKIIIFSVWVLFCFAPIFFYVCAGEFETQNLNYTEMEIQEVIKFWFGIVFASFAWALLFFVVALGIYLAIKILFFATKLLFKD